MRRKGSARLSASGDVDHQVEDDERPDQPDHRERLGEAHRDRAGHDEGDDEQEHERYPGGLGHCVSFSVRSGMASIIATVSSEAPSRGVSAKGKGLLLRHGIGGRFHPGFDR